MSADRVYLSEPAKAESAEFQVFLSLLQRSLEEDPQRWTRAAADVQARLTEIVAQLAKQLAAKKKETGQPVRGLISICAAGGQGVTAILEA